MGEMAVMGGNGDTKILWDADNDDEVAAARRTFDDLRAKRYNAYSVKANGKQDERITTFDPEAASLIMVPPMVGG